MRKNDDRMFIIETAIRHNLGSKEEIELFGEISLALELIEDDSFKVTDSGIGGGIEFGIVTKYPDGLPEKVGLLFFNVSIDFNVNIKEIPELVDINERYFYIQLNKTKNIIN